MRSQVNWYRVLGMLLVIASSAITGAGFYLILSMAARALRAMGVTVTGL